MIPKIIHYCWFGGSEMQAEYKGYVEEWKTLHPNWDVMLWNENSFKDDSLYYRNALEKENWANVSNYVRLKVLFDHGGIYFDTDIKVIKAFDELLIHDCFIGFESGGSTTTDFWVNNAVMGARPKHSFVQKCIETLILYFDGTEKANESSPKLVTKVLIESFGLKSYGSQTLADGLKIFEKEVFYPIPWNLAKETENYEQYIFPQTFAIHMWGRTWFSRKMILEMLDDVQFAFYQQNNIIKELRNEVLSLTGNLKLASEGDANKEALIDELKSEVQTLYCDLKQKNERIEYLEGKLGNVESKNPIIGE